MLMPMRSSISSIATMVGKKFTTTTTESTLLSSVSEAHTFSSYTPILLRTSQLSTAPSRNRYVYESLLLTSGIHNFYSDCIYDTRLRDPADISLNVDTDVVAASQVIMMQAARTILHSHLLTGVCPLCHRLWERMF